MLDTLPWHYDIQTLGIVALLMDYCYHVGFIFTDKKVYYK